MLYCATKVDKKTVSLCNFSWHAVPVGVRVLKAVPVNEFVRISISEGGIDLINSRTQLRICNEIVKFTIDNWQVLAQAWGCLRTTKLNQDVFAKPITGSIFFALKNIWLFGAFMHNWKQKKA